MANHRCFSYRIANSAKFLQMPSDCQLLYFHMIIRADDDGVVEAYPVQKLLGLASDNFKILIAKGFIKQLNDDQVVVITEWLEHNKIRADRKVNSIYHDLLKEQDLQLVEPIARKDVKDNSKRVIDCPRSVHGQHKLSKDKLSKVKISKVKLATSNEVTDKVDINYIISLFKPINPSFERLYANKTQRKSLERLIKKYTYLKVENMIKSLPAILEKKYSPVISTPIQLENKLGDLMMFIKKDQDNKINIKI